MRLHVPFPRKSVLPVRQVLALPAVQDVFVDAELPADVPDTAPSLNNELNRVPFELLVKNSACRVLRQNMLPCLILSQTLRHVHDIGVGLPDCGLIPGWLDAAGSNVYSFYSGQPTVK